MLRKPKKEYKVFLIEHDITCLKVSAIVNFEQIVDLTGGMLHDLIHKAAGPQLEPECKDKARIIHAVYPNPVFGFSASDRMALVKCHDNVLRIACDKKFRTIAFACLYHELIDQVAIEATLNAVMACLVLDGSSKKIYSPLRLYLLGCYEVYTFIKGCTCNVFIVMDCMTYGSLDIILTEMQENQAFFSEQSARYILYCCTHALAFLHSHNIIHRDVKSANILVSNDGRAKLGDFGLSANLDSGAGMSVVGTPRYMAPEIARQFVGHTYEAYTKEVDVFSLGIVGIELACGQLPHREGTTAEVCDALCDAQFPFWLLYKMDESITSREAQWSSNYTHFVEKCLAYEASKRMKAAELVTLKLFDSVYS